MRTPYSIRVTVQPEAHQQMINQQWQAQFNEELIWTKARIARQIRAVDAGQVETLAHLRGQICNIEAWNRELPEFAEGTGVVLIADHEATITPVELIFLRRKVHFLEMYRAFFDRIEGIEDAYTLMGGRGSAAGIAANESPIPSAPQSVIYRECVRHQRLDLWVDFHRFRTRPDQKTWEALRVHTVPWEKGRSVELLVEFRSSSWSPRCAATPSQMDVRRALTPELKPSAEMDELPAIAPARSSETHQAGEAHSVEDNVFPFPSKD